ncbi:ABC transporter substrate-binding protein [Demequina maris]|uniref:ABC transporter substrate-binding protein n=1 Tax=Demequina maris TaxID=1638982 RepID=UPI000780D772|nr:extracellular solute-binding protein [Demequina maris]
MPNHKNPLTRAGSRSRSITSSISAVGAVAAIGLALTGCSATADGSENSTSGGPSSGTLRVQVQAGAEANVDGFLTVFKELYPDVSVETLPVSQTAKTGSNLQVLTSNDAPDVAVVPTNTQVFSQLTGAGELLPLDEVWAAASLDARYGEALASALKTGGTPYVVSYDSTIYNVVYYHKAIFADLGIAEPQNHRIASLDELESIVAALKQGGKQGLAIGPADNYQASWMLDAILPTSSTPDELQNYLSSWQTDVAPTVSYTDPAFIDALDQIKAIGDAGVFQDGYLGQDVAQAQALFVTGEAGMLLNGSYSAQQLVNDGMTDDEFGWAMLPPVDSGPATQLTLYNGDAFAIPARAKNPEMAQKFLEVVMSVEGQTTLIANGALPSVNDIPKDSFAELLPQVREMLADVTENGGQPGWTSTVPGGLGQQLVDPLIQEMFNGNESPESIGTAVQEMLTKVRTQ